MKLLESKQVETEKKAIAITQAQRVARLNEVEAVATRRFNAAQERAKTETAALKKDLAAKKAAHKAAVAELTREITALESRRRDALTPLKATRKEADERLQAVVTREKAAVEQEGALQTRERDVVERLERVLEREQESAEERNRVVQWEARITDEETRLKESQQKLAAEWVDFHKQVHAANADLAVREQAITGTAKANALYKESLDRKAREQEEHDRDIVDRRATLERAWSEFNTLSNNNGKC